jgi:U3 small nucleolar RNA-associated protein 19
VHRERAASAAGAAADPFLEAEVDPARCAALESSLWELATLRQHYSPAVSRFVAVLERELGNRKKTQEIDLSMLCGASYASMFAEENERRMKDVPLAFYEAEAPIAVWDLAEEELAGAFAE